MFYVLFNKGVCGSLNTILKKALLKIKTMFFKNC